MDEDKERGVQFFPDNWTKEDMFDYASGNLAKADEYMKTIKTKNIILFCRIPLALAHRTLHALKNGKEKIEATVDEILKNG